MPFFLHTKLTESDFFVITFWGDPLKIILDSNDRRIIKKICLIGLFGILLNSLMGLQIIFLPILGLFWCAINWMENKERAYALDFARCAALVALGLFWIFTNWDFIKILFVVTAMAWVWLAFEAIRAKALLAFAVGKERISKMRQNKQNQAKKKPMADRIIEKGESLYGSAMAYYATRIKKS